MRNAWRQAHRAARAGLRGRELFAAILAATGAAGPYDGKAGFAACRMQSLLDDDSPPRPLAVTVLNAWGLRHGMRSPDPGPGSYYQPNRRFQNWQRNTGRAADLRHRLDARGLLEHDAGGWVQAVRAHGKESAL